MYTRAEYLWLDGANPTQAIRSKTRILDLKEKSQAKLSDFPDWSFDGSSTEQAEGDESDCILKPVSFIHDPIRGNGNYLVMCEVFLPNGQAHPTNSRKILRDVLEDGGAKEEPWIGFEQEYTLFQNGRPMGWPENGYPAPQGPYYCGVGQGLAIGREFVEAHTQACLDAGVMIYGTNAEVMPAQWEFQVGFRGIEGESADPLTISDHLWYARWLLLRLSEQYEVEISFAPKPIDGDWNGAGKHSNFSTKAMRDPKAGGDAIESAVKRLEKEHFFHISVYGDGLEERLTGAHETCEISEFRSGTADRGASIRIPAHVAENGYGYIEDRRPASNADPYVVSAALVKTICGLNTTGLEHFTNQRIEMITADAANERRAPMH